MDLPGGELPCSPPWPRRRERHRRPAFQPYRLPGAAGSGAFRPGPHRAAFRSRGTLHWEGDRLLDTGEVAIAWCSQPANAIAAAAVPSLARGLDPLAFAAGLRGFAGVPHRLPRRLTNRYCVLFVNDSKATNVGGNDLALQACREEALRVHLILAARKGPGLQCVEAPVPKPPADLYLSGRMPIDRATLREGAEGREGDICAQSRSSIVRRRRPPPRHTGRGLCCFAGCSSFDQFTTSSARASASASSSRGLV